jgi:UDPglucose 6-dehydrogenase
MASVSIAVLGTGYVGLVAGACLADCGYRVACIDRDKHKIAHLQAGALPIYEPGLAEVVARTQNSGQLVFTTDAAPAIHDSEIIVIAVGTPQTASGESDLSQIFESAAIIGAAIRPGTTVLLKSTVPVGTTERVRDIIQSLTPHRFSIAFNPEFLREGSAVADFRAPSRTMLGCEFPETADAMRALYSPFISENSPFLSTDIRSAEIMKYASNAMLATRISFMNSLASLCEKLGADIEAVKLGMGLDNRIGSQFLNPGVGIGGSCFPKDIKSLIQTGNTMGEPLPILSATLEINKRLPGLFVDKIKQRLGSLENARLAVWGLAYKANTDDMREAPSIAIINLLIQAGAHVVAYDPAAMDNASRILDPSVQYSNDPYTACNQAQAVLILTEWAIFRQPDWNRLTEKLARRLIVDGRNLFDPEAVAEKGFEYISIGRRPTHPRSRQG